jgi:cytochrome c biogenesis protein CcmG/thiol:disulfide interchange protein DsbE
LARHDGTIVGVTYKDNTSDSEAFVRREHISYPVLRDVTGNFIAPWGVNGVPETFVIDRQGRIVALRRYQLAGNWLAKTLAPLLAEAS